MATDEHFQVVGRCRKLRVLHIKTRSTLADTALEHLGSLRESLEGVHLSGQLTSVQGLRPILCPGLKVLDFGKLSPQSLDIRDVLRTLAEMCPNLEELDLGGWYKPGRCVVPGREFKDLVAFLRSSGQRLRRLDLGFGIVTTDAVLAAIMGFVPSGQLDFFRGARPSQSLLPHRIVGDVVPAVLPEPPYAAEVKSISLEAEEAWQNATIRSSKGWDLTFQMWTVFLQRFQTSELLLIDDVWGDQNLAIPMEHFCTALTHNNDLYPIIACNALRHVWV